MTTRKTTSRKNPAQARQELFQGITDQIIDLIKDGELPIVSTWTKLGRPTNLVSNRLYRGANVLLLTGSARKHHFPSNYWLTYKQAQDLGGHVKAGEKGTKIIFWKQYTETGTNELGEEVRNDRFAARGYVVFNVHQCEGIEAPASQAQATHVEPIEAAEAVVAGYKDGPKILNRGDECFYNRNTDEVNIPPMSSFINAEEYYSSLFHELAHSTGHPNRTGRVTSVEWGTPEYSKEELIAELTAAFLCGECRIEKTTMRNSASYLQQWLRDAKLDPGYLVSTASQAQRAADYILGIRFDEEEDN